MLLATLSCKRLSVYFQPARSRGGAHARARAQVKTYAVNNSSGHTFYVMGATGAPPDRVAVEAACREVGGQLVDCPEGGGRPRLSLSSGAGSAKFSFSFLNRQWTAGWGGAASPCSSYGSS